MNYPTHYTPTLPWPEAYAAFLAAYGAEQMFDHMVWTPAYQISHEGGEAISPSDDAEMTRLTDVRCDAEDVMIAAIAPDMPSIITKIEYARHRWSDVVDWPDAWWNAVLADLHRLASGSAETPTPAQSTESAIAWEVALEVATAVRRTWNKHLAEMTLHARHNPECPANDPEVIRLEAASNHWCGIDAGSVRDLLAVQAPTVAAALGRLRLAIASDEDAGSAIDDLYRLTGTTPDDPLLEEI